MALNEGPSLTDPHESDGEESSSLSLCNLPMTGPDQPNSPNPNPSPPSDLFEFFFDHLTAAEMSAADDLFLRGKILPYKPPPPPKRTQTHDPKTLPTDHRRLDSLDGLDRSRGCWKGGFTADYRKLKRVSDSDPRIQSPPSRSRPSWYLFVFGSVKVPAEMEMKDIRSRQRRRNPSPLGGKTESVGLGCDGRGPWKLLRSLSCKAVENAVVTATLSVV